MEIVGIVVKVTKTHIRLRTIKKKQEIDIFYTENKIKAVSYRFEPHVIAKIEVEPQEIEVDGCKLAKLWLKYVICPEQLKAEDYSSRLENSPVEITSVLYRKND